MTKRILLTTAILLTTPLTAGAQEEATACEWIRANKQALVEDLLADAYQKVQDPKATSLEIEAWMCLRRHADVFLQESVEYCEEGAPAQKAAEIAELRVHDRCKLRDP